MTAKTTTAVVVVEAVEAMECHRAQVVTLMGALEVQEAMEEMMVDMEEMVVDMEVRVVDNHESFLSNGSHALAMQSNDNWLRHFHEQTY